MMSLISHPADKAQWLDNCIACINSMYNTVNILANFDHNSSEITVWTHVLSVICYYIFNGQFLPAASLL